MSETLLGVIIGGAFTFLGGILGAFLQHYWDAKRFRVNQMKKAYEAAQRFLIQAHQFNEKAESVEDIELIKPIIEETAVLIGLYASKKVSTCFEEVSLLAIKYSKNDNDLSRYATLSDCLINQMRLDLSIDKKPRIRNSKFLNLFHHSVTPKADINN